ncbi:MAG TPA: hypothetical protein DEW39_04110 [Brevibacterium sp.]|uniref:Uncharacterized protein n=1 Tax=Brevibacterium antiquum CNRZ 918 TaxID=1255637 RepID=A0A2H1KEE4_9MICO|nr:hypothetical protein BANT918_02382 [Brevibacterium antiquum CNRZ 918]HCG55340.1 hypothetical protein [Brevibacterium sp.]
MTTSDYITRRYRQNLHRPDPRQRAHPIEAPIIWTAHLLAGVGRGMAWVVGVVAQARQGRGQAPQGGQGVGHAGRGR